jgi:uncharacterized protein YdeI (BOF family)
VTISTFQFKQELLMTYFRKVFVTSAAIMLGGATLAIAAETTIRALPDRGNVTVSGTVEKVKSAREFTLRDPSGKIDVEVDSPESAVLKPGDNVIVTGKIEKKFFGLAGKEIDATNVRINQGGALSQTMPQDSGVSMDQTQNVPINQLPNDGLVKLSGTVDAVKSEKNFTMKDNTGAVDVQIQSNENIMLTPGAEVTVLGYVTTSPLMGKDVRATQVIVAADAGNLPQ